VKFHKYFHDFRVALSFTTALRICGSRKRITAVAGLFPNTDDSISILESNVSGAYGLPAGRLTKNMFLSLLWRKGVANYVFGLRNPVYESHERGPAMNGATKVGVRVEIYSNWFISSLICS
jgi:hypothetical protein